MPILIKNCGLSTPESIACAIETGASFAGFVHHEPSPRHVALDAMAQLVAHARSSLKTVAVLVNPTDTLLADIATQVKPDFLQLHDVPSLSRMECIAKMFAIPLIVAIPAHHEIDVRFAEIAESFSAHILFDAKEPGSGKSFDWSMLRNLRLQKPWFLAGGLTAANVARALRETAAPMVDVSSGIESAPGVKSPEKIAAFNRAVLETPHA